MNGKGKEEGSENEGAGGGGKHVTKPSCRHFTLL